MPTRYTDADPFALVDVDPNQITQSVLETAPKRPQWGRVVGGDWDQDAEPFDDRLVPRGLRQRFVEGRAWGETDLFTAYTEQLSRFGNAWGECSTDGFEKRCTQIEELYQSLQRDGYRRQDERAGTDTPRLGHRIDEINVDIGRDGTLYWRCYGQHRLALAKLLEIETVPVLIHRRHREWQRHRDNVRGAERRPTRPERLAGHPDLRAFETAGVSR